jgi:CMP-2-keto-3-deoxyoctulosonic acid synthetase
VAELYPYRAHHVISDIFALIYGTELGFAIPARLTSTRFSATKQIGAVAVPTGKMIVFQAASSWGMMAIMTSDDCLCGTARIASVIGQLDADIHYYNIKTVQALNRK